MTSPCVLRVILVGQPILWSLITVPSFLYLWVLGPTSHRGSLESQSLRNGFVSLSRMIDVNEFLCETTDINHSPNDLYICWEVLLFEIYFTSLFSFYSFKFGVTKWDCYRYYTESSQHRPNIKWIHHNNILSIFSCWPQKETSRAECSLLAIIFKDYTSANVI